MLSVTVKNDYPNIVALPGGQILEAGQTAVVSEEEFFLLANGASAAIFSAVSTVDINDHLITP